MSHFADGETIELLQQLRAENEALKQQVEQGKRDAERLDYLDQNLRFKMAWSVGKAPFGNISVTSVIKPLGNLASIREAIDAVIAAAPKQEK